MAILFTFDLFQSVYLGNVSKSDLCPHPPQISAQYNPFPMDFDLDLYTGFWKETKYMSSSTEPPHGCDGAR